MAQDKAVPVEALVQELLDTGTMNEDSVADLEAIRADFRAGTLHPDDARYLVAFHKRIMAALSDAPPPDEAEEEEAYEPAPDLRAELEAAIARAEKAEAEVARLEALLAERDGPPSGPA